LGADTTKGLRPSLRVADPGIAESLYELSVEKIRTGDILVQTGVFGAHMDVALLMIVRQL
jgi:D-tyrosyl-tRNA(Tyr) deacylase